MDLKARMIHPKDFIIAKPDGVLDLEKSRALLKKITEESVGHEDFHILIDFRKTNVELSTVDIWELSNGLSEYGTTFKRKTAILVREDENFDKVEFFELCTLNRGFEIYPFIDFEEAIMWLLFENNDSKNEST